MYKKEKKTCNLKCMKSVSFLWKTISNNQVISKNYFYSSSVSQKRITPKLFSKNARSTEKAKAATVGALQEKLFFKISRNSQKTHVSESLFLIKLQTLEQVTLAHVFSCEFCEIFKNTFFTEHFRTTASEIAFFKIKVAEFYYKYGLNIRRFKKLWSGSKVVLGSVS